MIRERFLHVVNGCQHKELSITFPESGLISVTGRNGIGKTNVLRLNSYALTGIVDRAWGTQASLNRDGTRGGYAEVELLDTRTNDLLKVRRHFTTSTRCPDMLWINDLTEGRDPDVTGRQSVDAHLEGLFGVPMKILSQILWVRQGDITWLLTASQTSVDTFLKEVFDARKINTIKDAIWAVANRIQGYMPLDATIEDIEQKINLAVIELDDLHKKEAMLIPEEVKAKQVVENALAGLQGTIPAVEKASRIAKATADWESAKSKLDTVKAELKNLKARKPPQEFTSEETTFYTFYRTLVMEQFPTMQEQYMVALNHYKDWESLLNRDRQERTALERQKQTLCLPYTDEEDLQTESQKAAE